MKPTEIVVVLDRSGSMADFVTDTIGGYDAFIKDQKQIPDDARLTTVLFDTEYEYFEDGVNLQNAVALTELTFVPRGMTALLDAIGDAINKVEERQKSLPDDQKTDRVIMAIITDGQENSSHKFNKNQIKEMISAKTAAGWRFEFLSANMDAVSDAIHGYGIAAANTVAFAGNSAGYQTAYRGISISTKSYRTQEIKDKDDE